ncbi:hypothetical protein H2198_006255 [Neophaeococcomyces mojaviensis]|uniref:Uncharacterized protein n=1 Tax=Neophaeococcomyces mojaviensis TaxID=3383035 RepID=A0ACC3A3F7_9EURO|nr:hypothetical protein H2198_006255 [Knufia sp. JES_112]
MAATPGFALPNTQYRPSPFNHSGQVPTEWVDFQGGGFSSHLSGQTVTLQQPQSSHSQPHSFERFSNGSPNQGSAPTQHSGMPGYTVAMSDLQRPSSQPVFNHPTQTAMSQPTLAQGGLTRFASNPQTGARPDGLGLPHGSELGKAITGLLARIEHMEKMIGDLQARNEHMEKIIADLQARLANTPQTALNEKVIASQFRAMDKKCFQNETRTNEITAWIRNLESTLSIPPATGERVVDDNSFSELLSDETNL